MASVNDSTCLMMVSSLLMILTRPVAAKARDYHVPNAASRFQSRSSHFARKLFFMAHISHSSGVRFNIASAAALVRADFRLHRAQGWNRACRHEKPGDSFIIAVLLNGVQVAVVMPSIFRYL